MLRRTSHVLLEICAAVLAGLVLIAAVGAWRLSHGPLSLGFVKPYLDRELANLDGPFSVEFDDVILKWAGWERAIDIVIVQGRTRARNGDIVAVAPEISVSLSGFSLLRGRIAPTSLELIRPQINLTRDVSRGFALGPDGTAGESDRPLPLIIGALTGPDRTSGLLARLKRISVVGGRLFVDDRLLGTSWGAPHADIVATRTAEGLNIRFDLDADFKGQNPTLRGAVDVMPKEGVISVRTRFENFRPDRIAEGLDALAPLRRIRLAMRGTAEVGFDIDGRAQYATFDLSGGQGVVSLPHAHFEALEVRSVGAKGRYDVGSGRLTVERAALDLGGPEMELTGTAEREDLSPFRAEVVLRNLPLNQLARYWPPDAASGARSWITRNMEDGSVTEARFRVSGRMANSDQELSFDEDAGATVVFSGTTVHYLRPLEPGRRIDARAEIDPSGATITIENGALAGLAATDGLIRMTGFESGNPRLAVDIVLKGPLADALGVLDHPKFAYASKFGFNPARVRGATAIRLAVRLPMRKELKFDGIDIRAAANLQEVTAPAVAFGRDLTDGQLILRLDRKAMSLTGRARIDGIAGDIAWYENFSADAPFARRYDLKAVIDDAARSRFGLDPDRRLDGPVRAELAYVDQGDGKPVLSARLDLEDATVSLPTLKWSKPPGRPGSATFQASFNGRRLARVDGIDVSAEGLRFTGRIALGSDGESLSEVVMDRFALGPRTDIKGTMRRRADGTFVVAIRGPSLDASPFVEKRELENGGADSALLLQLRARIDKLWLSQETAVANAVSVVRHDGHAWRRIALEGDIGEGQRVSARYEDDGGPRRISLHSSDAGSLLRKLGLFENLNGGVLAVTAERREAAWAGKLEITEFSVSKAPVMARLLTLASLTGISNMVAGKGVAFSRLDMPFTFDEQRLVISDARAVGSELGITAEGTVDLGAERADIEGTVVPAYTINSLLGKIPVLGALFTGSKGDGMFAATYAIKGPFDNTVISVNPLAALAPGFLRDLLRDIGEAATPVPPEPLPQE